MWGVDVATCSSSCSLLLARSPPGGALRSLRPRRGRQRLGGAGRGRSGRWRAGWGRWRGAEGPHGDPRPPPSPPGSGLAFPAAGGPAPEAGAPNAARGPPGGGPAAGHVGDHDLTGSRTPLRTLQPPRAFHPPRPPPSRWWLGWVGMPRWPRPTHPRAGVGGGAGRPGPPPGEGWQGAGGGVAPRRGWRGDGGGWGGWRTLTNLLGAVRVGASLSLARGDAVGSWGGVLVGQSAKKKMSSSPRGNGQRGARR